MAWRTWLIVGIGALVLQGSQGGQGGQQTGPPPKQQGGQNQGQLPIPEGYPTEGKQESKKYTLALDDFIELKWTWHLEGDGEFPIGTCSHPCQGGKHPAHAQCDTSCDGPCPGTEPNKKPHTFELQGQATELGPEGDKPPQRSHQQTLEREFDAFQLPSNTQGGGCLPVSKLTQYPKNQLYRIELDHWATPPCASVTRHIKAKRYTVTATYRIWDEVRGPGNQIKITEGPKGTLRWRVLLPIADQYRDGEPVVNCRCEATQTLPPEHGYIPGRTPAGGQYAYVENGGKYRQVTGWDVGQSFTKITCPDMNQAIFQVGSMPPGNVFIPAGWELECTMGNGQDEQLQEPLYVNYAVFGKSLIVNLKPTPMKAEEKTVRALCLNMEKHEPDSGMSYRLVPPKNPAMAKLAQLNTQTRIHGPWEQVRLWIATDFASYDSMSKRLIPMPGQGTYLREMYKCASACAISASNPRVQSLMEPRFLLAENYDPKAVAWMLEQLLKRDSAKLATWMKSQSSTIAEAFSKGDAKDDAALVGLLAEGFATFGGEEGADVAIWLMTQATPEAHRKAVAESQGAAGTAWSLSRMTDSAAAETILDWLASTKSPFLAIGAGNINPALPEATKKKAADLLASAQKDKG